LVCCKSFKFFEFWKTINFSLQCVNHLWKYRVSYSIKKWCFGQSPTSLWTSSNNLSMCDAPSFVWFTHNFHKKWTRPIYFC
jgi:hypothetical protein